MRVRQTGKSWLAPAPCSGNGFTIIVAGPDRDSTAYTVFYWLWTNDNYDPPQPTADCCWLRQGTGNDYGKSITSTNLYRERCGSNSGTVSRATTDPNGHSVQATAGNAISCAFIATSSNTTSCPPTDATTGSAGDTTGEASTCTRDDAPPKTAPKR